MENCIWDLTLYRKDGCFEIRKHEGDNVVLKKLDNYGDRLAVSVRTDDFLEGMGMLWSESDKREWPKKSLAIVYMQDNKWYCDKTNPLLWHGELLDIEDGMTVWDKGTFYHGEEKGLFEYEGVCVVCEPNLVTKAKRVLLRHMEERARKYEMKCRETLRKAEAQRIHLEILAPGLPKEDTVETERRCAVAPAYGGGFCVEEYDFPVGYKPEQNVVEQHGYVHWYDLPGADDLVLKDEDCDEDDDFNVYYGYCLKENLLECEKEVHRKNIASMKKFIKGTAKGNVRRKVVEQSIRTLEDALANLERNGEKAMEIDTRKWCL